LASRTDSIAMIRDSAGAVVPAGGDLRRIRALRFRDPAFDRQVWTTICRMGWVGLRVPEDMGGSGLGMSEFCALIEALGAGLVPEPLVPVAMAARALSGPPLAAVLAGDTIVIPAWQERANSLALAEETCCAGGRVSGRKVFVPQADGADAFLVTTQSGPVLVERNAPGVSLIIDATQDGGSLGTVTFCGTPAQAISGDAAIAFDEAVLATSAYLLGVMERAFSITVDYLQTRRQFGRAIGSFQALQHRAVDLKIQIALTRASVESAAARIDSGASAEARGAAVSRAKARASKAAMLVTRQAIQFHGAIGYTDEHDIGLYLRKAMVLSGQYGSADAHRRRYYDLSVRTGEE
jgi:alkylation response protein AidB-like acyl-CoA dehydrogenase